MYRYKDVGPVFNNGVLAKLEDNLDIVAIKNSLRNIFIVQKNTMPGKPWFGNPLDTTIFDLFDQTTEMTAFSAVQNAIAKFEPRVELTDLKISILPEFNRIIVDLKYGVHLADSVVSDNLLIPFSHNNSTYLNGRGSKEFVTHLTK